MGVDLEVEEMIDGNKCPICKIRLKGNLGLHIKKVHGKEKFNEAVIKAKQNGMSDIKIGDKFGITFNQLQSIITARYGINVSNINNRKPMKRFAPKEFHEEQTTVWSFRNRGSWATHQGKYRGNWSPFIPRNVILKYSKQGETVLDYFVGGGTTAIEAKLLGRKCIAIDINPAAVQLTKENLSFEKPLSLLDEETVYEPDVRVGDARVLSGISDESIDLICAHPPYAGIINYSSNLKGDLSQLEADEFLSEIREVAKESFRVLKPGRKCAILIGDTRKKRRVVPIGFRTINVFLEEGFGLKELVIKRQHNCKTTGFWYARSIEYNFLLLAHEYLPIFEKPKKVKKLFSKAYERNALPYKVSSRRARKIKSDGIETTTVWIFPEGESERKIEYNLSERFVVEGKKIYRLNINKEGKGISDKTGIKPELIYVFQDDFVEDARSLNKFRATLIKAVSRIVKNLQSSKYLIINVKDIRGSKYVYPSALLVLNDLRDFDFLRLKEIIVVTSNHDNDRSIKDDNLFINHRYLLVFETNFE